MLVLGMIMSDARDTAQAPLARARVSRVAARVIPRRWLYYGGAIVP
jgi:hypothetical protein